MAWQFIETKNLTDQWITTDWLSGNLFKLEHNCSFPSQYSWKYTGLIGQVLLDADFNSQLYGEVQKLYFSPTSQYFLFNALDNIDLRKLAIKGYWSKQTTFSWDVDIYVWDVLIGQNNNNTNIDLSPVLDEIEILKTKIDQKSISVDFAPILTQIATLNTKLDQIITDLKPGNSKK